MTSFVDANVIIKAFTNNIDQEKCRNVLNGAFITNTLCMVEVQQAISVITKDKMLAADCVKSLLRSGGKIVPLDINLLFESYKRTSRENLNAFDLVHLATAVSQHCGSICSYDKDFDGLEIKRTEP